jgi:hypothetical protein
VVKDPVASLTLLTTLLDFSDTGEIGLFIDENGVSTREATIGKGGLLPARDLQNTFSFLRANDLVWNYVTGNYLKGQKPQAFDLLYWNSDSTNLPGPFACWYMRNMYLENNLRVPGKLEMCGQKGRSRPARHAGLPAGDPRGPYRSLAVGLPEHANAGGKVRFVLGASGHIAGVINPASKNKRSYWVNDDVKNDAEGWLTAAEEKKGSWWTDWAAWLKPLSGEQRAPRKPGNTNTSRSNRHPDVTSRNARYKTSRRGSKCRELHWLRVVWAVSARRLHQAGCARVTRWLRPIRRATPRRIDWLKNDEQHGLRLQGLPVRRHRFRVGPRGLCRAVTRRSGRSTCWSITPASPAT